MVSHKILLMDTATSAINIKNSLESWGYEVQSIFGIDEETVYKSLTVSPDLILIDTDSSGNEILNILAKLNLSIPVIILCFRKDANKIYEKFDACFTCLEKPLEINELKSMIKFAINNNKLQKKIDKESNFYETLDHIEKGCQIISPDWKYIYVNDTAARHLQKEKDELVGKDVGDTYSGGKNTKILRVMQQVMEERRPHKIDNKFVYPNQTANWFEFDVSHVPEGIFILSSDINNRKKKEIELKKSQQKFKRLIDFTSDWEYWIDPAGKLQYVSPSCERISGYAPEEFIEDQLLFHKIIHPEDQEHIKSFDKMVGMELRIIKKQGQEIWISHECELIYTEDGEYLGQRGSIKDITKRKTIENNLRESENKFRELIENAADPLLVHDFNGNFVDVNRQSCESLGYSREELLQMNVTDIEMNFTLESAQREWATIKPGAPFTLYGCQKRKNGTVFPVEIRFAIIVINGKNLYMALCRDITEIKKAHKKLRESEEKYRHVVETASEGIILIDNQATIIEHNRKFLELLGSSESVIGKNLIEFSASLNINKKENLKVFNEVINGKPINKSEWRYIDRKGMEKFVKAYYSAFKRHDKTIGIAVVVEDITELKLREISLNNSLKEKESLLREIHHRVNNNMQIISSLLNLQKMYVKEPETVDVIVDSQSRIKSMSMIHEKLYLSEDLSHINFKDYVEKLISDIYYIYSIQQGRIQYMMNFERIELNMETAIPLGLILNELVSNSLKYAFPDENGSIRIELKSDENGYVLLVSDDGIGLSEDVDFEKTDSLGFQLVNNLVNQINGKIVLDRSHGTEFKINFNEVDYNKRF